MTTRTVSFNLVRDDYLTYRVLKAICTKTIQVVMWMTTKMTTKMTIDMTTGKKPVLVVILVVIG